MRNESRRAVRRRSTSRSRPSARPVRAPGSRSRTSNAARRPSGAAPARRSRVLEAARAEGLDVAADQYPYTAAATTLATILPPALLRRSASTSASRRSTDPHVRDLVRAEIERGISGWENVAADPGWGGIRISYAASHPDWAGRSLAELADERHGDPADLAFEALVADRLDVSVVIDCMSEPDVETIMAVPWIAVCTDAEGRRPGHPILDAGRPHPRTYGSTARVLGTYARERGVALARDGRRQARRSVPAARLGLRDRGSRSRGRLRRPRGVRPRDGRRRRDLRPIRRATRPGSSTSSSTGEPAILDGVRDRRAAGSVAAALVTATGGSRRPPCRASASRRPRRRQAARRATAVHPPALPAVAWAARRHPPGARRGRDRAGGRPAWLARSGAAHPLVPDRA